MNYIFMKCYSLAQEKIFSDNYGATALAVFEEFDNPDDLVNMDIEELTAFIAEKGENRSSRRQRVLPSSQNGERFCKSDTVHIHFLNAGASPNQIAG